MASNRLRAVNKNQGEPAEMDMSPMIDMVFLLLLFFLVVSNPKTIKIDPRVQPPVAANGQAAKSLHGKIVINIRDDGALLAEDLKTIFDGVEDLKDYLEKEKDKVKAKGKTPVLHIRGDKRADFKFCQRVIKAGAAAGIDSLAYGAYNKAPPRSAK
ncbi:MAG: biopolymer transporter ExbD [Akkermansiaceae bacterium]|jgi:biopolymer transport protein ExbD|tara:strand:+ start:2162 stop:2629 length:468 start_codon:yes stop_codon:yes gene_type:complete